MEEKKQTTPNTFRPVDGIKPLPKPGARSTTQIPFEMELEVKEKKAAEEKGGDDFNTFRPSDGIKPLPKPDA